MNINSKWIKIIALEGIWTHDSYLFIKQSLVVLFVTLELSIHNSTNFALFLLVGKDGYSQSNERPTKAFEVESYAMVLSILDENRTYAIEKYQYGKGYYNSLSPIQFRFPSTILKSILEYK